MFGFYKSRWSIGRKSFKLSFSNFRDLFFISLFNFLTARLYYINERNF
jgi:hypothetical protein